MGGGQRPPTSWWMLSMARLYLSQSLCMLSKLEGKGKAPVTQELGKSLGAQPASREGQPTARQSQPAPRWAGGGLGPPGEPRVGDEAEPTVWG